MQIRRIDPGVAPSARRGGVALLVGPGLGRGADFTALPHLLGDLPEDVIVGVHGVPFDSLPSTGEGELWWLGDDAAALERAIGVMAPADVVLVSADCALARGWLGRLRTAAGAGPDSATASALTGVGIGGRDPREAAEIVAGAALGLRPRLAAPSGRCVYVRRAALELVGPFDAGFADRCTTAGLIHVLADDVLAVASETEPPPAPPAPDERDRLAMAIGAARRALHGLAVVIDGRELRGPVSGWHVGAVELVGALAATGEVRLTVLLAEDPTSEVRDVLRRTEGVRLVHAASAAGRADIVHRPFQVSTPADLAVLAELGDRLVLTQHDLIGYHNPGYFRDRAGWLGYRELTATALALADHAVFVSAHARDDALEQGLVEPVRTSVVHNGIDHSRLPAPADRPPKTIESDAVPFLLCLGSDLRHKNRLFALRILCELRAGAGWPGTLVFAGPEVALGSSRREERRYLTEHPELAGAVRELGPIEEAEKRWLLEHAALVLYPTIQEGFGLVPFEAALAGTPCLWAAGSALREVLPVSEAWIVPWDVQASAAAARRLIEDDGARAAHIGAVRRAAEGLRWDRAAAQLLDIYQQTCETPASPAGARERAGGLMRRGVSEDAMRLIGPGGLLPAEVERPLLALAARQRLAAGLFWSLRSGYAVSRWMSGRRRR